MEYFVNELDEIIKFCDKHKWLVRITAALVLILHCILNTVYMGKPVPVTGIILQKWMCYVNVITAGCFTGIVWGFTAPFKTKK